MIFCIAPVVTWALVFADPPADGMTMQPRAVSCFTKKTDCDVVAMSANAGFELDRSPHRATCEEQPADRTDKAHGGPMYWNPQQ